MDFRLLLSAGIGLLFTLTAIATETDAGLIKLKNNPFSQPDIKIQRTLPQVNNTPRLPEREPKINLEATLVSPNGSMVIVNGALIAIGEKVEGFKLIEVREGEADFGKGRKTRTYIVGNSE